MMFFLIALYSNSLISEQSSKMMPLHSKAFTQYLVLEIQTNSLKVEGNPSQGKKNI